MTTQMFLYGTQATTHLGTNVDRLTGATTEGWDPASLQTSRGAGSGDIPVNTVTGPTAGLEFGPPNSVARSFISLPLAADVTISGTITFNIWMVESAMANNAGAQCVVQVIRATDNSIVQIINSEKGTELATSTAAQNWTGAPTSTVVNRGDRLRVTIAVNDAGGTMASATAGATASYGAASAGVQGDSYVTFNENLTFESDPSGTVIYLTDADNALDSGTHLKKDAWTSRGSGVVSKVTNSATGWTTGIQWTNGAGGSAIEWYTHPLAAVTIQGMAKANLRLAQAAGNGSARAEIARVDNDGTNATTWCTWCISPVGLAGGDGVIPVTETDIACYLSGDDLSITAGQRLRIRVFIDDPSHQTLTSGNSETLYYSGTSGGASGDTYITFPATLTENVSATSFAIPHRHRNYIVR